MERVVRERVCEVHPDRIAKMERLRVLWPPTGQVIEIDPCEEDADRITAALAPFVGVALPLTGDRARLEINTEGLPEGMLWLVSINAGVKGGRGKEHATWITDQSKSLCGLVEGENRWLRESRRADDERCRTCTKGVKQLLEQTANRA